MIQDRPPDGLVGLLAEGDKAIKLGKFLLNPKAWHAIKKDYLTHIGPANYAKFVGDNPDITFKGMQIMLTGARTSSFYGKSYPTGMSIKEFVQYFYSNF